MSWQACTAATAAIRKAPSSNARFLMLVLANYADQDGCCWPSQRTLVNDTGLSERTIRRTLQEMEEVGLIRRDERRRGDGSRAADHIYLLFVKLEQPANLTGSDQPATLTGSEEATGQRGPTPGHCGPTPGHSGRAHYV